jgi:lipoic acid synthetase
LFKRVQPQDQYEWALTTLRNAKAMDPDVLSKSGIMLGLGEEWDEIVSTMQDLADCGLDILTIGQYLQPSQNHLPIERYYKPEAFEELKRIGLEMGMKWVESGPLVRSSYRAEEQVAALSPMARSEKK